MENDATNPNELATPVDEEVANEQVAIDDELEAGDETAEGEEQEPEFAEIEYDGELFKVPKKLEKAILQEKDYTEKTQTAAEKSRALALREQEFEIEQELYNETREDNMQLALMESRMKQFQRVNWSAYQANEPQEAQAAWMDYQQTKDHVEQLKGKIDGFKQQALDKRGQAHAQSLQQAVKDLQRPDPRYGWHGKFTDEVKQKLATRASTELGWSDARISAIRTAEQIKELHAQLVGIDAIKAQRKALQPKKADASPVPTVGGTRGRVTVNPDDMSTADWMKWDDARMRRKSKQA